MLSVACERDVHSLAAAAAAAAAPSLSPGRDDVVVAVGQFPGWQALGQWVCLALKLSLRCFTRHDEFEGESED